MDVDAKGQSHCLEVFLFLDVPSGDFPSGVASVKGNGQYATNHPRICRITSVGFECLEEDFAKTGQEVPESNHSTRIDSDGGTLLCL